MSPGPAALHLLRCVPLDLPLRLSEMLSCSVECGQALPHRVVWLCPAQAGAGGWDGP